MADAVAPTVAFRQHEFPQAPQPTISLPEASLQSHSSAPSRSPSPFIKEEPQSDEKRPAKKRKSWGQELPTPKTNLPPRKRAKTEDEKEQRRIERVLRNRAAAQSSRERKRQEVEKLEGEKSAIEQQNQYLKDRLMAAEHEKFLLNQKVAKMSAQITSLREGSSTPLAADTPAPEPDTFDQTKIKQEIDDHIFSLSAPQLFSSPSTMTYSPSLSPSQPSLSFDVSVCGRTTPSQLSSMYGSKNCDPIIFGDNRGHFPDSGFDSLFATDDSLVHDQDIFGQGKEKAYGFPPLNSVSETDFAFTNASDFTFDSMVDLDPVDNDHDEQFIIEKAHDLAASTPNAQTQTVATAPPQQPSIGASA